MKRFVIGDIHGGFKALIQCLQLVNFDYDNDELIQLGDICDGWSETHLVIDELKKIKNFILIRGNHDEWAVSILRNPRKPWSVLNPWYKHGGKATYDSYLKINSDERIDFVKFLSSGVPYYIDSDNNLFVHAGYNRDMSVLNPNYNIKDESYSGELWWGREMWQKCLNGLSPNDNRFNKVFIGHTPTTGSRSSKPINIQNVWNVDTGSAFFGPLTIMNIDTLEYFQSDYVFKLYPDEKGRNSVRFNNIDDNWRKELKEIDVHI
jgi:serine/threonine protein phosphatase 1